MALPRPHWLSDDWKNFAFAKTLINVMQIYIELVCTNSKYLTGNYIDFSNLEMIKNARDITITTL